MSDAGYKRWAKTEWWHEGYDRLWQGQGKPPPVFAEAAEGDSGEEIPPGNQTPMPGASDQTLQQNVIYLTADSEDELTELKPEEVYIIGGICDHNRYKVDLYSLILFLILIVVVEESMPEQSKRIWCSDCTASYRTLSCVASHPEGPDCEPGL